MNRYIAFLRAINVGGHTVKMDRLRALFEELGLARVETFIASGNVIFEVAETDTRALETRIEAHLRQALGFDAATFLRTPEEVAEAAAHEPFARVEGDSLYVSFLREALEGETIDRIAALGGDDDRFAARGRELYWWRRGRLSDSPITNAQLERAIRVPGTMRNVTTVRKLAAKYPPAG
jgi:uncharacterized protein (DUF1697 family)